MFSQILNGDSFFYVTVDIVDAFNGQVLDENRTFFLKKHFSGKIFCHNMVEVCNFTD